MLDETTLPWASVTVVVVEPFALAVTFVVLAVLAEDDGDEIVAAVPVAELLVEGGTKRTLLPPLIRIKASMVTAPLPSRASKKSRSSRTQCPRTR